MSTSPETIEQLATREYKYGFYTDVAYHVAYGRDDSLFTPGRSIWSLTNLEELDPALGVARARNWAL
jgi:hypothetical protein